MKTSYKIVLLSFLSFFFPIIQNPIYYQLKSIRIYTITYNNSNYTLRNFSLNNHQLNDS